MALIFIPQIQELAAEFLSNYVFIVVGMVGAANADVQQLVEVVEKFEKKNRLLAVLEDLKQTKGTSDFHNQT